MKKLAPLVAILGLCACSGKANVGLNLMDAPPAGVTAVKVWVASMDVHVVDKDKAKDADPADGTIDSDGNWTTLAVDKEIDLVQHQGETAAAVLGQLEIPEGKITQIRLHLDTAKTTSNKVTYNGTDCALDLSKINAKGIKISHVFKAIDADSGADIKAWVDVELDKALKASGSCFQLDGTIKLHKVTVGGKDFAI